jgi:hypothetical protein
MNVVCARHGRRDAEGGADVAKRRLYYDMVVPKSTL